MRIKVLCIGDVVGSPGRRALAQELSKIVAEHEIACAIVNGENIASGSGITPALFEKLIKSGANLVTLGDHIYRRKEIIPILETSERVVRPANLAHGAPGKEFAIYQTHAGPKVAVISLLGRLYMKLPSDCPFRAAERVLGKLPDDVRIVIVDLHAEATSEKIAMGWHLDGRVSLIFGTHTHVQTADERVLPGGTGYISDLGMTGPYDSVLGRDKGAVLQSMVTAVPARFEVATDDVRISGVIAEINADNGHCTGIERLHVRVEGVSGD
ncbi:MAG: TIGR00282 family metallophosphoesterase [Phycisphaerales bacterium]|nr:TIGR00282 family metallophosphoesterase [Phycisphaerales bacterium]